MRCFPPSPFLTPTGRKARFFPIILFVYLPQEKTLDVTYHLYIKKTIIRLKGKGEGKGGKRIKPLELQKATVPSISYPLVTSGTKNPSLCQKIG